MIQPPPPQQPPPAKPHSEEDANFLRGQDQSTHPDDDDKTHIAGHMAFLNSETGQLLDKNGKDMAERHIRAHAAQRLDKNRVDLQNTVAMMQPPPDGGAPPEMAAA